MKYCILLTACINPSGMSQTVLQDSKERRAHYLVALKHYLNNYNIPIVFAENSGIDLSNCFKHEIEKGKLEILTFSGNDYERARGKGYGEALNIEYAIQHSEIIKDCDCIVKITGRLIVENLNILLTDFRLMSNFDVIASFLCKGFIDSRIFVAKKLFFINDFLVNKEKIDDESGYYFESLLLDVAKSKKWRPFLLASPAVSGISGTYGTKIELNNVFTRNYWRILKLNWRIWLQKEKYKCIQNFL